MRPQADSCAPQWSGHTDLPEGDAGRPRQFCGAQSGEEDQQEGHTQLLRALSIGRRPSAHPMMNAAVKGGGAPVEA